MPDFPDPSVNGDPDPSDEEDDVYFPEDYSGDYPLEGDDSEDDEDE